VSSRLARALLGIAAWAVFGCELERDRGAITCETAGLPCSVGVGACEARGVFVCVAGRLECSVQAGASALEVCNGADDDCNGMVDDEIPDEPCVAGIGACARGFTTCEGGRTRCVAEAASTTQDPCDGIDNDCDGKTDEDTPEVGFPCSLGKGECEGHGLWVCDANGGVECRAEVGEGTTEVCNGADDDCNGKVDDAIPEMSCVAGLGICAEGVTHCIAGSLACVAARMARPETCNDLDDDCDGAIDIDVGANVRPCRCEPTEILAATYSWTDEGFGAPCSKHMCKTGGAECATTSDGVALDF
jgi:hypothetical protein